MFKFLSIRGYLSFICLCLCLGLTACSKEVSYEGYPEVFVDALKTYDQVYSKRVEAYETEDIYRCYEGEDQDYYCIIRTYGYEEDMLIGLNMTPHAVKAVDILYENESEDYGDYVTETWFLDRFVMAYSGPMDLVKKAKTNDCEVVAITGATITSQAVLDAVNTCIVIMEDGE